MYFVYSINSRLCEKLNEFFLPRKHRQTVFTQQHAKAWSLVSKSLLNLAKNSSCPTQLYIRIRFEKTISIVTLSDGRKEISNVTLEGIKDIIPRAETEGIKVEFDLKNNEFSFIFTPSNY